METGKTNNNMERFGNLCFGIISIAITTILGGYVFMTLWEWLIVYVFDVDSLTLIQGISIRFFVLYLTPKKKSDDDFTAEKIFKLLVSSFTWAALFLSLGWVITLYQ